MGRVGKVSLIYLLILVSFVIHLQAQTVFKSHSIDKKWAEILNKYSDIDSVSILFWQNKPFLLYLDEAPKEGIVNEQSNRINRGQREFYMLDFESDQFFLKRRYADLYEFVFQRKLISKIKQPKVQESFRISLTREGAYFRPVGGSASGPGAHFNRRGKQAFFNLLNTNLLEMKTPVADSLLIVQAIVETDGWLSEPYEIIHGTRGPLYDYFFKIYTDFFESKEKYLNTYGLFMPKLQNGTPRRGLIDIYVRLNPDNTITVSAIGDYRKLMIKNYKQDRNHAVYL